MESAKSGGIWLGKQLRKSLGMEAISEEQEEKIREKLTPKNLDFIGRIMESLPTSYSVREGVTRNYTGDYLEPKNEKERFADDIAQDFATLAIPVKGKIPFARSLGMSVVANSGSELAKAFNVGEKGQAATKIGLLFALGLTPSSRRHGLKKYIDGLYSDMRATLPEDARISSAGLEKSLNKIEKAIQKGDVGTTTKKPVVQKIKAIREKITNGSIGVDELLELTKDTNEAIFDLGLLRRHQNKLYDVRGSLHEAIKSYGNNNKNFLSKWNQANQAYGATATSRNIQEFIKKTLNPKDYILASGALGLGSILSGAPLALKTGLGVGSVGSTAYIAAVLNRAYKSPALRKYYLNSISSALKENKGSFARNMSNLERELKKSFKKEPLRTVEFEEEEEEEFL